MLSQTVIGVAISKLHHITAKEWMQMKDKFSQNGPTMCLLDCTTESVKYNGKYVNLIYRPHNVPASCLWFEV